MEGLVLVLGFSQKGSSPGFHGLHLQKESENLKSLAKGLIGFGGKAVDVPGRAVAVSGFPKVKGEGSGWKEDKKDM